MTTNQTYFEHITASKLNFTQIATLYTLMCGMMLLGALGLPILLVDHADFSRWTWGGNLWIAIPLSVVLSFVGVLIHEGLHGLFFWLYSGKAQFGAKLWTHMGPVFYATSAGSRFTRLQYAQIGLAPQLLTLFCFTAVVSFQLPAALFYFLIMVGSQNLGGGTFDMYATYRVSRLPSGCLIEDVKDGWKVYRKEPQWESLTPQSK